MSVVFDVLDSLNSIRNVEDLKKRWEIDSTRPNNLSQEAVKAFVSLFTENIKGNSFVICLANFTLRYRNAVALNICPPDEQKWIMPYVRYAERLKAFITCGDTLGFEPDFFSDERKKKLYILCI